MVRNGRRFTWPAGELIGRGQVIAVDVCYFWGKLPPRVNVCGNRAAVD